MIRLRAWLIYTMIRDNTPSDDKWPGYQNQRYIEVIDLPPKVQ